MLNFIKFTILSPKERTQFSVFTILDLCREELLVLNVKLIYLMLSSIYACSVGVSVLFDHRPTKPVHTQQRNTLFQAILGHLSSLRLFSQCTSKQPSSSRILSS